MRQLLSNFVALLAGFLGVRLISFISTWYMINALGPEKFGVLSSGLAFSAIFSVVLNFGLDDFFIREAAHAPPQRLGRLLSNGFTLKLLLLPLAILVVSIFCLLTDNYWWVALWMGLYAIVQSFFMLCCSVMRGLERMRMQAGLQLINMILIAATVIPLTWLTRDVNVLAPLYTAATLSVLAVAVFFLRRYVAFERLRVQASALSGIFKLSIPFGINYVLLLMFDRVAIMGITIFQGPTAVGLFNSVYNLVLITTVIPLLMITAVLPMLVRQSRSEFHLVGPTTSTLLRYVMIVGCAIAGSLYIGAPVLIRIFDAEYASAAAILQTLSWSIPGLFAATVLLNVLETIGQQRQCARLLFVCIVVATPITLAASIWGTLMAVPWAYAASQYILAGTLLIAFLRHAHLSHVFTIFCTPLLALGSMVLLFHLIPNNIALYGLASLAFIGVLLLGGAINKQDWLIVQRIIRRDPTPQQVV